MASRLYDRVEEDAAAFPHDAYRVRGWPAVAVRVLGWETEPVTVILCPDCDFHAIEREGGGGRTIHRGSRACGHAQAYQCEEPEYERTGRVAVCMVGDDAKHIVDAEDLQPIKRSEYCGGCGQIGCHCDAYDDE